MRIIVIIADIWNLTNFSSKLIVKLSFYKDFGLFPDVVNLAQVKNIFFALSDILYAHFFDNEEEIESSNLIDYKRH